MFVDHIKIKARAGNGGNGSRSFRREKYVPKGGPDGGDGGKGGDVILEVSAHVDDLRQFFFQPHLRAKPGGHGGGRQKNGRGGKDVIAKVPPGTLVFRPRDKKNAPAPEDDVFEPGAEEIDAEALSPEQTGEAPSAGKPPDIGPLVIESEEDWPDGDEEPADQEDPARPGDGSDLAIRPEEARDAELIADLTKPGERVILCHGGKGGRGNVHFKSSTNRAPQRAEPGGEGEEGLFYLELRRIADAALVGYPNAGKSTLISRLSAAHPKVAAYPFTTLQPVIGVVENPEEFGQATVADIPGLIEGAHDDVGLGHDFLRHIMRCKTLFFVVDMAGTEGRDPRDDVGTLRRELDLYHKSLVDKPWLILANKMDVPEAELFLEEFRQSYGGVEIIPISAERNEGIDQVKRRLFELIKSPEAE